jgi:chromosome partitioning protein
VLAEMDRVRGKLNPALRLTGILVTRTTRTNHSRQVIEELREEHGEAVFGPTIRLSVRVPEAAAAGRPVTTFAPESAVSDDIRAVAAEVLHRGDPELEMHHDETATRGWRGVMERLVGSGT